MRTNEFFVDELNPTIATTFFCTLVESALPDFGVFASGDISQRDVAFSGINNKLTNNESPDES